MATPDFSRPRKRATAPGYAKETTTGRRGANHEKRIARRSGATRVSGSGSKPGRPGDLRDDTFLREAKTTRGKGRTISGKEITQITRQAMSLGKIPLMEICFEGQELPTPKDWVLIPASDFDRLIGAGADDP